jgi:hypothetical protein
VTKFPKIEIECRQRGEDDPTPYQASIVGDGFRHGGVGASPSEALLLAAAHWHARSIKTRG